MTPSIYRSRAGFTLIELLAVIAILGILATLIFSTTSSVFARVDEVRTRREIAHLGASVEAFKLRYGQYPPSQIVLKEKGDYDGTAFGSELESLSANYLKAIFTGIDLRAGHDWNGNGTLDDKPFRLQGDECLVFFLGGIPSRDPLRMTGFSMDKSRPAMKTPGSPRDGPFYDFVPSRLAWPWPERAVLGFPDYAYSRFGSDGLIPAGLNDFPIYKDPYGVPYAYFRTQPVEVKMH